MKQWRMCETCGLESDETLDKANDEHMEFDGAHYPVWYTEDEV